MRVACLLVPDLPLAAALRASPELAGRPVAIATRSEPRAELVAVSPEAARSGVRAGFTTAQARAACAGLMVRATSPALERATREALLDVALSVSPRGELAPPAGGAFAAEAAVLVDASGVASLFTSEAGFAGALAERAERLGLRGVVAVAGSREVAHLAARALLCGGEIAGGAGVRVVPAGDRAGVRVVPAGDRAGVRVVPAGAESAFLAPLPLDLLDPDDSLAMALTRFGVRRIGELARLPRRALATRLGADALRLADLARGKGSGLPLPPPAAPRIEEALDLEFPLDRIEPLAFVLRGMLSRMASRLEMRGLACGDLDLELELPGRRRDVRRVGVAAPTCDVRVLVRLVTLSLESRPPSAEIEALSLSTEGLPTRRDQLDLFRPPGPVPAVLDRTLAELESLCGDGRIGAPAPADDHRPDAFTLEPFTGRGAAPGDGAGPAPPLAARALRPPVGARVHLRGGRPERLESAVARGDVVRIAGPWRTSGGWWSPEERFAFDHYDVETSDGTLLRLRWDAVSHRWSVDAIYD